MSTKKTAKKVAKRTASPKEAPANYFVGSEYSVYDGGREVSIKGALSLDELVKQVDNQVGDWFLADNEDQVVIVFKEVGRYRVTRSEPAYKLVKA